MIAPNANPGCLKIGLRHVFKRTQELLCAHTFALVGRTFYKTHPVHPVLSLLTFTFSVIHSFIHSFISTATFTSFLFPITFNDHYNTLSLRVPTCFLSTMASDGTTSGADAAEGFSFSLYKYTPSLPAAAAAVVVFAALTAVHAQRMYKTKAYYFTPFFIGGICEYISLCYPSNAIR